ncbi:interferon-inducible GTPase 5-like [Bufo gargarizans]|uniref:interferon-inducible GTPase 5-like n=1 Tax=Bufo gargarizans TaxID=30331 RepID=UPI001CF26C9B|nr:interferon-inducible GTPase 5-like [Bufo gargarizans]
MNSALEDGDLCKATKKLSESLKKIQNPSIEIITKEEVQEMNSALEDVNLCKATKKLSESLKEIENPPIEIIAEEEVQEIRSALQDGDLCKATEKLSESLKEIESAPLNIAITGESGTGKSTFVNAFRGMDDEEEDSAKTGVVETTKEPMSYPHQQYPNVTVWDLPGIGTPNFVADNYLQSVKFSRYDFFIIMSSDRFKQNDILLAKAIQEMDKKFYFVRSKVDSDLLASQKRRKKTYNEQKILKEIRGHCIQSLKDGGIIEPQVFLLSCLDLDKYDFIEMQDTLGKELPEHKRHIFLISLPNISLPVLQKKQEALKKDIWKLATLSCAVATVPIPGLSVACDIGILVNAMIDYRKAFGLDEPSLKKMANKFGKDVSELKSVIKSPLVIKEINKELVISLLAKGAAGGLIVVEFVLSTIPLIGSIAAGGISYGTTYWMLSGFLKEIADDAVRVLTKALESPV